MQEQGGNRRVLFVTGTRADFGKLKPLMRVVEAHPELDLQLFVTGMHCMRRYGYTVLEVRKAKFENIHVYMNQHAGDPMEMVLANTIAGLSRYVHEERPDLIVVHGDRVEALAGAISGALSNTLVAHIEGGEVSGTIDELIRHATSKLAHLHLVANEQASQRLFQMGELARAIFVIGSPDIDVMLSPDLPELEAVKAHYEIPYDEFGILLYHPVTTELERLAEEATAVVDAVLQSKRNFVVIYPNNDEGTHLILEQYRRFRDSERIRMFPSVSFESFLTLLKHCDFILGNSSAGIREAPVYGTWSINVGTRQQGRASSSCVLQCPAEAPAVVSAIENALSAPRPAPSYPFGRGDSATRFAECLDDEGFWSVPRQKTFQDVVLPGRS